MKKHLVFWIVTTLWLGCGGSSTSAGGAAGGTSSGGSGGGGATLTPTTGGTGGSGGTAGMTGSTAGGGTGGAGGAAMTTNPGGMGGTGGMAGTGGTMTGTGGIGGSTRVTFLMNVTVNGPGTITSVSNPPQAEQISCGSTCSVAYGEGAQVTLMVNDNGAVFTGWSGDAFMCGTATLCTFIMISDISATASFTPN